MSFSATSALLPPNETLSKIESESLSEALSESETLSAVLSESESLSAVLSTTFKFLFGFFRSLDLLFDFRFDFRCVDWPNPDVYLTSSVLGRLSEALIVAGSAVMVTLKESGLALTLTFDGAGTAIPELIVFK